MSTVLITGTSSGIGLETAVVLGRAGHSVYATMRNLERGAVLREVVEREKLPISIVKMDVDSDESVDGATSAIRARTGCIDVLVNNAGIERTGSIEGLALDDFRATMETNYFGATPLDTGLAPGHAKEAERVHHQRDFGGWADRVLTAGAV